MRMDDQTWLTRLGNRPAFMWTLLTAAVLIAVAATVLIVWGKAGPGLWFTAVAMVLLMITSGSGLLRVYRERRRDHEP